MVASLSRDHSLEAVGQGHAAPGPERRRRLPTAAVLVVVGALAVVVRLLVLRAGLPDLTHPDEPTNLLVGQRMAAQGAVLPHFYNYPSILFEVIAGVVALSGHPGATVMPALVRAQNLGIVRTDFTATVLSLRLVTLALSVGLCVVAALVVRRLTGSLPAMAVTGLLLAASPLAVNNGTLITPDTYAAFFTVIALGAALRLADRGALRNYVWTGIAVGIAAGSKYNAALVGLAALAGHLVFHGRRSVSAQALRKGGALVVAAVATLLLTTPGLVFDTHNALHDIGFEAHHYSTGHPGAEGHTAGFYARALLSTETILVALGVIGLIAASDRRWRRPVVVVAAFAIPYCLLIGTQRVHFSRDLTPLLPALAVLAGVGTAWLISLTTGRRLLRGALIGGAVLLLAVAGAQSTFNVVQNRAAGRQIAAVRSWLFAHIPAGSPIYDGAYGPFVGTHYRLIGNDFRFDVPRGSTAKALVVTELGDGRYLSQPSKYPVESAGYRALTAGYCTAAFFHHGPWVRVMVPCSPP